jgi:hypothetical protein
MVVRRAMRIVLSRRRSSLAEARYGQVGGRSSSSDLPDRAIREVLGGGQRRSHVRLEPYAMVPMEQRC